MLCNLGVNREDGGKGFHMLQEPRDPRLKGDRPDCVGAAAGEDPSRCGTRPRTFRRLHATMTCIDALVPLSPPFLSFSL